MHPKHKRTSGKLYRRMLSLVLSMLLILVPTFGAIAEGLGADAPPIDGYTDDAGGVTDESGSSDEDEVDGSGDTYDDVGSFGDGEIVDAGSSLDGESSSDEAGSPVDSSADTGSSGSSSPAPGSGMGEDEILDEDEEETLGEGEGLGEGETLDEGEGLGEGETLDEGGGLGEGETLDEGEGLGEGETLDEGEGLDEGETLDEGEGLGEGETLDEGEGLDEGETLDEGEGLGEGETLDEDGALTEKEPTIELVGDDLAGITQTSELPVAGVQTLSTSVSFAPTSITVNTEETIYDAVARAIADSIKNELDYATVILSDNKDHTVGGNGKNANTIVLNDQLKEDVKRNLKDLGKTVEVSEISFENLNLAIVSAGAEASKSGGDYTSNTTSTANILGGLTIDANRNKGVGVILAGVTTKDGDGVVRDIMLDGAEKVEYYGTAGVDNVNLGSFGVEDLYIDTGYDDDVVNLVAGGKVTDTKITITRGDNDPDGQVNFQFMNKSANNLTLDTRGYHDVRVGGDRQILADYNQKFNVTELTGKLNITAASNLFLDGQVRVGSLNAEVKMNGGKMEVNAPITTTGALELLAYKMETGTGGAIDVKGVLTGQSVIVKGASVATKDITASNGALELHALGDFAAGNLTTTGGSIRIFADKATTGDLKTTTGAKIEFKVTNNIETGRITGGATVVDMRSVQGEIAVDGTIATNGSITVHSGQDTNIDGSISGSEINLTSDSGNLYAWGLITAKNNLTINAGKELFVSGTVKAVDMTMTSGAEGMGVGGDMLATGNLHLTSAGDFGFGHDKKTATMTAKNMTFDVYGFGIGDMARVTATGDLTINAKDRGIYFAAKAVVKAASARLTATAENGILYEDGSIYLAGGLTSTSGGIYIDAAGTVGTSDEKDNRKALTAKTDLTILAGREIHVGALTAGTDLVLNAGGRLSVRGATKGKNISISGNGDFYLDGAVTATEKVEISSTGQLDLHENEKKNNSIQGKEIIISSDNKINIGVKLTSTLGDIAVTSANNQVQINGAVTAKRDLFLVALEGGVHGGGAVTAGRNLIAVGKYDTHLGGAAKAGAVIVEATEGYASTGGAVTAIGGYVNPTEDTSLAYVLGGIDRSDWTGKGVFIRGYFSARVEKGATSKNDIVIAATNDNDGQYTDAQLGGVVNSSAGSVTVDARNKIDVNGAVTSKTDIRMYVEGGQVWNNGMNDMEGTHFASEINISAALKAGGIVELLTSGRLHASADITGTMVNIQTSGDMNLANITATSATGNGITLSADGVGMHGGINVLGFLKSASGISVLGGTMDGMGDKHGHIKIEGAVTAAKGDLVLHAAGDLTLMAATSATNGAIGMNAYGRIETQAITASKTLWMDGRDIKVYGAINTKGIDTYVDPWDMSNTITFSVSMHAKDNIETMQTVSGPVVEMLSFEGGLIARKAITSTLRDVYLSAAKDVDVNAVTAKTYLTIRSEGVWDDSGDNLEESYSVRAHGALNAGNETNVFAARDITTYGAVSGASVFLNSWDTLTTFGVITSKAAKDGPIWNSDTNDWRRDNEGNIIIFEKPDVVLASGNVFTNAAVTAKRHAVLEAFWGSIVTKGAITASTGMLEIYGNRDIDIRGAIKANYDLIIDSRTYDDAGNPDYGGGRILLNAAATSVNGSVAFDSWDTIDINAAVTGKYGIVMRTYDGEADIIVRGALTTSIGEIGLNAARNVETHMALTGGRISLASDHGNLLLYNTLTAKAIKGWDSSGEIELVSQNGGIDTRKNITAATNIKVTAWDGGFRSMGALTATSGNILINTLHSSTDLLGAVTAKQDITVTASFLKGKGAIKTSAGGITFTAEDGIDLSGAITAKTDVTMTTSRHLGLAALTAGGDVYLTARKLDQKGAITGGSVTISTEEDFHVNFNITTNGKASDGNELYINAQYGEIKGIGTLTSAGDIYLTAGRSIGDGGNLLKVKHGATGSLTALSTSANGPGEVGIQSLAKLVVDTITAENNVILKVTGDLMAAEKTGSEKNITGRYVELAASTKKVGVSGKPVKLLSEDYYVVAENPLTTFVAHEKLIP